MAQSDVVVEVVQAKEADEDCQKPSTLINKVEEFLHAKLPTN
jgi:hypothetical protein